MSKKKLFCFIILICLFFSHSVYAITSKIDTSTGKIISKDSDYYFNIPVSWANYIEAERESSKNQRYYDKINFYYLPRDKNSGKSWFLSLYTFKNPNYKSYYGYEKILETKTYTFAIEREINNYYEAYNDKVIFNRFLAEVENEGFIYSRIVSTSPEIIKDKNQITINNNLINDNSIIVSNEIYLPVRSICEELGYLVKWDSSTNTTSITTNNKTVYIYERGNSLNKYEPIIYKDKLYMPSLYFVVTFQLNMEIDENYNVKIYN